MTRCDQTGSHEWIERDDLPADDGSREFVCAGCDKYRIDPPPIRFPIPAPEPVVNDGSWKLTECITVHPRKGGGR